MRTRPSNSRGKQVRIPLHICLSRSNLDPGWDPSLKLQIQQELWNRNVLGYSNNDPDNVVDNPNMQQL